MPKAAETGKKQIIKRATKQSKLDRATIRVWAKAVFLGFRRYTSFPISEDD